MLPELLTKYSHHVRILDYWPGNFAEEPPVHTQLRRLTIEPGGYYWQKGHQEAIRRMIGANTNLMTLGLAQVALFKRDNGSHENYNNDMGDDNTLSPTNPLGHLKTSLLELYVIQMDFRENEFYYTLRDVAQGNLQTLELGPIDGSFDLQDLVFVSLTRFRLWLRGRMNTEMFEIIGRSPHLNHLEIHDAIWHKDETFGGSNHHYELLVHFLRGTRPVDPLNPGSTLRQWARPQLATLRLYMRHWHPQDRPSARARGFINHPNYLELIRACSNTYNKLKQTGHLGSLRELDISLCRLDDDAREAIEMHSENLEVLKMTLEYNLDRAIVEHGRVLARLFRSCRRLRTFEYRNVFRGGADISTMMESLIEEHILEGYRYNCTQHSPIGKLPESWWSCPDLESLELLSTAPSIMERVEEKDRWLVDSDNEDDDNHNHGSTTWMLPSFKWDPNVPDGTAFLLDAMETRSRVNEAGRMYTDHSNQGESLIKRFLRYVSPSKKLRNLQLAQLKFVKPCACMSCNGQ
ncbi:hypothetical protein B0O80DRAFT_447459 [Mortierella sp. GBAus27b]|nr:hypothetical protein B0O80DRAFT_447459 [Mortierella sp. GBAus27b]